MFIQSKSRKITGIISFTAIYLLIFLTLAVTLDLYHTLPYTLVQIVLTGIVFYAHKSARFSNSLLWCLSLWGFFNLAGSFALPDIPPLDQVAGKTIAELTIIPHYITYHTAVHIYGFGVATWVSWQILCSIIHNRYQRRLMPSTGLLILIVSSAIGYGGINEMVEFFTHMLLYPSEPTSYAETCADLVANSIGAIIAAITIKIKNL